MCVIDMQVISVQWSPLPCEAISNRAAPPHIYLLPTPLYNLIIIILATFFIFKLLYITMSNWWESVNSGLEHWNTGLDWNDLRPCACAVAILPRDSVSATLCWVESSYIGLLKQKDGYKTRGIFKGLSYFDWFTPFFQVWKITNENVCQS